MKDVDTKTQLADMLTKGNFTRGEWNHLLHLLNIMNFSMFSRNHFRSIEMANTMSKRFQEKKTGEEPKHLDPPEVGSLVQNQTRTEEAAGNCWRDHLQRFKMLDLDEQFRTIYGSAVLVRPISFGMYYETR